jgi:uncharacterized DUF497 family protein
MRDAHSAALKHGVAAADIKHALRHPLRVQEEDDRRRLYLGPARDGELLEVVTALRSDLSEVAIHAMTMRPRYANLLPRE